MFKKRGQTKNYTGFIANNRSAIAIATLIGTIIGAGVLGIPYVVAQVGIVYGLLMVLLIGLGFLFINLFVGEMVLRTKGKHQMTGYAEKYLGKWGKHLMGLALVVGTHGALIAYTLGEGSTLHTLLGFGTPFWFSIAFYIIGMFIVLRGLKTTGRAELLLIISLFIIVGAIGIFSCKDTSSVNFQHQDLTKLLVPYGVILFAYMGFACIPEVNEELGKQQKSLKKAIIWGSVIPIILYILFSAIVVGIVGIDNFELLQPDQRIATIALSFYSVPLLGVLANIFALLTMFTSFLALSTIMLDVYERDYRIPSLWAKILIVIVPLLLILVNDSGFIKILGLVGVYVSGSEGIIMLLSYLRAKKLGNRKPEYSISHYLIPCIILLIMFVLGMVLNIMASFK